MIEPLFNYVIVKKDEEVQVTEGGFFVPETSREKPSTGTVLAVGKGKYSEVTGKLIEPTVKEGDRVFFLRLGGQVVEDNGEELTILKEEEILGIIH